MRLRQKKTHNLSEEAFYLDLQNQHFQTHNRKLDSEKRSIKDSFKACTTIGPEKSSYAQILAKFITNINLAKHPQPFKSKSRPLPGNILQEQNFKVKRFRKTSQNTSFDQQKKIDHIRPTLKECRPSTRKIKTDDKTLRNQNSISTNKNPDGFNACENKVKELSEQNIINNCFMGSSFNMADYARFVQSPYLMLNQQLMNSLLQINPFMVPNISQLSSLAQGMKNGLSRQLEIYETFRPQPSPSQIENKSLSFTALSHQRHQKIEKSMSEIEPQKKMSPDKIFKRASYHVGIAYSIYMDGIQKGGRRIKNFTQIDPTRFAKKYKTAGQRPL